MSQPSEEQYPRTLRKPPLIEACKRTSQPGHVIPNCKGDSYIVLQTSEDEDGALFWDVYFWIGSDSSQDEYGVAAYKANELDDLLGDSPVQHREVEG